MPGARPPRFLAARAISSEIPAPHIESRFFHSTYLGGTRYDYGQGVAVDDSGRAYVTGSTYSTDFPTQDPLQPALGGIDAFVAKICDPVKRDDGSEGDCDCDRGGDQDECD